MALNSLNNFHKDTSVSTIMPLRDDILRGISATKYSRGDLVDFVEDSR